MNLTIMSLTARAMLGRKRVLMLLPMPIILIGLTLIGVTSGASDAQWGPVVFSSLGISVILPLTALIIGSSALGLEIDDGTITHLLTKPLPRSEIVLSKLAVAWLVTAVATGVPLAAAALIAGSGTLAVGLVIGAAIGGLAYSALFLALSVMTKRPVAVGLVYIVLWENILVSYVSGTRIFSVRQHATAIADSIGNTQLIDASVSVTTALVMAVIFIVVGTVGATQRLRSFALTGDAN
ncbi:ABC transporter permease [Actinophytocola algeriensis]|uniref:ABC-2 type transport system permease protein n=1 Tax=Actinophytocola algeriensis TaxID=1768010 RepID=A0A7W7VEZ2_9PSEU|nr:ABC transporter permease subunit [Actinophytocola algeriensis]MBB4907768.1 ABC-2 type transport system permease protein [Actinophytocola algeriensis]MBE1479798.1 ABC-2 type transport system permease protein [Actinophytocola algeriensis]